MTHDEINDAAARRMLTESMPPYAVVEAEYAPPGTVPPWAAQYAGVRSQWLANFMVEDGPFAGQWAMTPYPLPMTVEGPLCWVPLEHLREIELVGSMFDD